MSANIESRKAAIELDKREREAFGLAAKPDAQAEVPSPPPVELAPGENFLDFAFGKCESAAFDPAPGAELAKPQFPQRVTVKFDGSPFKVGEQRDSLRLPVFDLAQPYSFPVDPPVKVYGCHGMIELKPTECAVCRRAMPHVGFFTRIREG